MLGIVELPLQKTAWSGLLREQCVTLLNRNGLPLVSAIIIMSLPHDDSLPAWRKKWLGLKCQFIMIVR